MNLHPFLQQQRSPTLCWCHSFSPPLFLLPKHPPPTTLTWVILLPLSILISSPCYSLIHPFPLSFLSLSALRIFFFSSFLWLQKAEESHEPQKRKWSTAWLEAQPVPAEGWPETGVANTIGHGFTDFTAELVRVVGAEPRGEELLQQPWSHFHGSRGLPSLPHVCDALRRWSEVPQMQKHRFARFPPRHQKPHHKEELE